MRLLTTGMMVTALAVVLAVPIQRKYYRGTKVWNAHPGSTAVWVRMRKKEVAKEKQLHTRRHTKAITVTSMNK